MCGHRLSRWPHFLDWCAVAPDHREDGAGIKVAGFFLNVGQVLGLKFFGRF